MNIHYIYNTNSNPICRDATFSYAKSLDFIGHEYTKVTIDDLKSYPLVIIDLGWLSSDYKDWILRIFKLNLSNVYYRIVDDSVNSYSAEQLSLVQELWWDSKIADKLISPYQIKYFDKYYAYNIPYHIDEDICNKYPITEVSGRLPKAILSGFDAPDYEFRHILYAAKPESTEILSHPGYSGRCWKGKVGLSYIETLRNYRVMVLTTTSAGHELLKYIECAEAGCAPIGEFPPSLLHELTPELKFLHCYSLKEYNEKLPKVINNWYHYATEYRKCMLRIRSKESILNKYKILIND